MAPDEKPYRVYRGGRVKGKGPVPATRAQPPSKKSRRTRARAAAGYRGPDAKKQRRLRLPGRPSPRRALALGVIVLLVLVVAWAVGGFFAVKSGVDAANKRLGPGVKSQLADQNGLLLSHKTTILLLGPDSAKLPGRAGDRHADSIMLVRTDPSKHRISYLSIPRDLLVPVPGVSSGTKINAAFQAGGAPLAIRTVREYTGVKINHVVVVDFGNFEDLIDAEGGIDVTVPKAILSNRFDCPFKTAARCRQWEGWRFAKGRQHLDGRRALIYSRIRENRLDPHESDLTRGARQQAVMTAATSKLTSTGTLVKLPFVGDSLLKPLATDLTTGQLLSLGWVKFRSSGGNTLYCRLGGDISSASGQSVIVPSEDNRNVLAMWSGDAAAQPPTSTFGPGCRKGRPLS
jgi:LCP family protein required for cell wall assembly